MEQSHPLTIKRTEVTGPQLEKFYRLFPQSLRNYQEIRASIYDVLCTIANLDDEEKDLRDQLAKINNKQREQAIERRNLESQIALLNTR